MRCSSHTSTVTPGRPAACAVATSAKRVGVIELGGSLTRSRARHTASATASAAPRPLGELLGVEAGSGHDEALDPAPLALALVRDEPVRRQDRTFGDGLGGASGRAGCVGKRCRDHQNRGAGLSPRADQRRRRPPEHGGDVIGRGTGFDLAAPHEHDGGRLCSQRPLRAGASTTVMD